MNLLYVDRPLVINPALAEKIGLNEAIILQQLNYWLTRTDSGVSHDGVQWVYNTYSEWREQAPFFSERTIQRVILKLEEVGIIRSEMLRKSKGDRTKFYTINQSHELLALSSRQDGITVTTDCLDHSAKMAPSSRQDGTLSTETTTETATDIKNTMSSSSNVDRVAGKPDSKKWQTEAAKQLIDYLNQKTGRRYRHTASNIRLIVARLSEGYTPDDVAHVIERKCAEWINDPQMSQYLRPSTLFNATKFNDYAGQIDAPLPEKRKEAHGGLAWDDTSWMEGMENDPF